ncbi:hypothetical protein BAE44_0015704 [Dichanthelium oligosanthes]|uniref:RING-type E3 ubiquitin transferase n=1 Tax=Dichanthelium oligosanthes TaxID=888268 RepID=A0A1E5VE01_9POAL|nr:hypothetical protein BAE44_0015704 [Dichanthelium oligosanthes]
MRCEAAATAARRASTKSRTAAWRLDDAVIKSLPSAQYLASAATARGSGASRECAVRLLEFADGDKLCALPLCAHAFHADCIDVWLRAHASCLLCRAAVALPPPVASPLHRAARRVRPSLDDLLFFHPVPPPHAPFDGAGGGAGVLPEIAPASPDQLRGAKDFLLKRSYSFDFERSLAVEAASTASPPWRYRFSAATATTGPPPPHPGATASPPPPPRRVHRLPTLALPLLRRHRHDGRREAAGGATGERRRRAERHPGVREERRQEARGRAGAPVELYHLSLIHI